MTGGRYEETEFEATGSGGLYARGVAQEEPQRRRLQRTRRLRIAVQALTDAADEDRATGGVDLERGIFPIVKLLHAQRASSDAPDGEIERPTARSSLDRVAEDALMSMPFYVSPEQVMADKAEFARKGIARGKSSVTLEYEGGVLLMAENPSTLSKIGEIYDRIAFAGVGKFSEFDQLRKIGVRYADTKGYAYSREDVRGEGPRQCLLPGDRRRLHPGDQAARGRGDRGRGRRSHAWPATRRTPSTACSSTAASAITRASA